MDAQIKKGVLEMCLLHKLSGKDYYGYPLMREMRNLFPEVSDSTFYAILRRLHKEGRAVVYEGSESGGPTRKYYRITEAGRTDLDAAIDDWRKLKSIVAELGIE